MEGGAARAMSEELDKLSVDAMWGTFINGMRRPGETVEQFSDRGARVATRDTERAGRAAAGGNDRPSGAQPAGPTFGVAVGVGVGEDVGVIGGVGGSVGDGSVGGTGPTTALAWACEWALAWPGASGVCGPSGARGASLGRSAAAMWAMWLSRSRSRSCRCHRPGPPRVFRTAELSLFHAASCRFRYSSRASCGVRYPSPE